MAFLLDSAGECGAWSARFFWFLAKARSNAWLRLLAWRALCSSRTTCRTFRQRSLIILHCCVRQNIRSRADWTPIIFNTRWAIIELHHESFLRSSKHNRARCVAGIAGTVSSSTMGCFAQRSVTLLVATKAWTNHTPAPVGNGPASAGKDATSFNPPLDQPNGDWTAR